MRLNRDRACWRVRLVEEGLIEKLLIEKGLIDNFMDLVEKQQVQYNGEFPCQSNQYTNVFVVKGEVAY